MTLSAKWPCTLKLLGWARNPLMMITELCYGDLKAFYNDKVEELQYTEWHALRLLRVGFAVALSLSTVVCIVALQLSTSASVTHR